MLLLVVVDRLWKRWALDAFAQTPTEPTFLSFGGFELTLYRNTHLLFEKVEPSLAMLLLVIGIIIGLIVLLVRAVRRAETWLIYGLLLVVVGAVSNLYDRLQYGFVIDFLTIPGSIVINLADVAITAGVVFILLDGIRTYRHHEKVPATH